MARSTAKTPDLIVEAPREKLERLVSLRAELAAKRKAAGPRWATPGLMGAALTSERPEQQTTALEALDQALTAVASGAVTKQMVLMPPQAGKSERVSRRFPLWLLADDPALRIVIVSFELEGAVRWGRKIKADVEANPQLGIILRHDSKAASRWDTAQGGGIYCVGIGGALTGRPVDMLIIDDPVKDRATAESALMRGRAWDWWENVAKPRARRTVLIQTRWHVDDLGGRLQDREAGEWEVLSIPAIAESPDDPLGRDLGEEIPTPRWEPGHYAALHKTTSSYVWNSVYQQRPTAAEGGLFKRGDWRFWHPGDDARLVLDGQGWRLDDCRRFITMDLATSTRTSADWTVAAAWAITPNGDLILLGRVRERVPQTDHMALLAPLRTRWLGPYDVTYVESRMFGSTLVYALGRKGLPLAELEADADKLTRALSAADLVTQHRVWLPHDAAWLDEWLDEHADFPSGKHDDQVDVLAYAARIAIAHHVPGPTGKQVDAWGASTGELDIAAIPY